MKTLKRSPIYFGCDPEFFFEKDGQIIGAEKILPETGLEAYESVGKVVIDGIQAELNPRADTCRQTLSRNIAKCFLPLQDIINDKKIKTSFARTVKILESEMDSLSDKSKQFGCSKSQNLYAKDITTGVTDGSKYFSRSAGGHIHIGMPYNTDIYSETYRAFKESPERLVKMLDIVVGNFCVMIDRDEGNKVRRKTYGRAGEHRLPSHGLEYRTLSNFWLTNYTLTSLVLGLARLAVSIVCHSKECDDIEDKILAVTDIQDVVKAINENDAELARKNYDKIKDLLAEVCVWDGNPIYHFTDAPFTPDNLRLVDWFIAKVQSDGLDYWFGSESDIIKHWTQMILGRDDDYQYLGWESFVDTKVAQDLEANWNK
jgi:hypothetical protein